MKIRLLLFLLLSANDLTALETLSEEYLKSCYWLSTEFAIESNSRISFMNNDSYFIDGRSATGKSVIETGHYKIINNLEIQMTPSINGKDDIKNRYILTFERITDSFFSSARFRQNNKKGIYWWSQSQSDTIPPGAIRSFEKQEFIKIELKSFLPQKKICIFSTPASNSKYYKFESFKTNYRQTAFIKNDNVFKVHIFGKLLNTESKAENVDNWYILLIINLASGPNESTIYLEDTRIDNYTYGWVYGNFE